MSSDTDTLTFVPEDGVFAVLQIDPVASLKHLNDPEAIAACAQLTFQEYLVFVPGTHDIRHPVISYRAEEVDFVVQGLPQNVPQLCIDSAMSIPIFPTTEHPTSRKPLQPMLGQLPWSDCYLSPFLSATVRCATVISAEDPIQCRIDYEERIRRKNFVEDDRFRQALAFQKLNPTAEVDDDARSATSSAGFLDTDDDEPVEQELSQAEFQFNPSPFADSEGDKLSAEERQELDDLAEEEFLVDLLFPKEASNDLLAVTFSHDISRIKELPNGRYFFIEQENMTRIKAESIERKRKAAEEDAERRYAEKTAARLAEHNQAQSSSRPPALSEPKTKLEGAENGQRVDHPYIVSADTGPFAAVLQKGKGLWHRVFGSAM